MGNRLFQLAKAAVADVQTAANSASQANFHEIQQKIDVAKNQISSAFANSNAAEKQQLQELQQIIAETETLITSTNA